MIFPSNFEQKLGFDTIRKILSDHCLSPLGHYWVERIAFTTDAGEIDAGLSLTAEMKQIIQFEEHFPAQDYYDMVPALLSIRIPGSFPEPEQMSEMRLSLITILGLFDFFKVRENKYPWLYRLTMAGSGTPFPDPLNPISLPPESPGEWESDHTTHPADCIPDILAEIEKIVNKKSEIRDSASQELHRIRKEKSSKQNLVERQVVQSYKLAHRSGWTPDDADITIRNGRLVIPLISAHKRKIPGFVHDESATGHTVYVEPAEIFETNNEIRELEYAERREIVRILIAFAALLRPSIDDLIQAYRYLGQIDFLRAKARFAIEINGWKPMFALPPEPAGPHPAKTGTNPPETRNMHWRSAFHPLLLLSHQKQHKPVVPLDIELNANQRILIISGPNAGGKSVCLKTVGLLQYMLQCGLLPPVKEDSEFTLFSDIFIDIGDEQSIDNDLSTYTSKLLNLKFFIEHINPTSLFLIDELGTGTDPSLGGAIAEASLEALNARKAFGIVTTHYSNLKLLASREPGIINGAMLFDLKKLKPLYQLKTGKPGSSFALEIAHEIGFPEEVLNKAREKTGNSQLDFDRELQNLEVEKKEISKKENEVKIADDFLAELIKKYEKLTTDLEHNKKEILEKARTEAKQLLDNSNKIIEKTIREIRETQAEKTKTKTLRDDLAKIKQELAKEISTDPAGSVPAPVALKPENLQPSPQPKHPYHRYLADLQDKADHFSLTLDLRGFRADEALDSLQRYIDDALLLSIHEVRILHGKGNGVLRQVTRDYLRSLKEIKTVHDAAPEFGGAGITEVTLK